MVAILKKELKRWFISPSFYLLLCVTHVLSIPSVSTCQYFNFSPLVLGFLTIGLGVTTVSREFKQKTYKLLFSSPISTGSLVLSKFLVIFFQVFSVFVVYTSIKFISCLCFGYKGFVLSEIVLGFTAAVILIAFYASVVLFASCCGSKVGVISVIVYSGFFVLEMISGRICSFANEVNSIFYIIYTNFFHFQFAFSKIYGGVFSLQSVGYFVVMTGSLLFLSMKFVESKRYL